MAHMSAIPGIFPFKPVSSPCHPEQSRLDYSALEREVVDHLHQLAEALRTGTVGFEWYSSEVRRELARVGW